LMGFAASEGGMAPLMIASLIKLVGPLLVGCCDAEAVVGLTKAVPFLVPLLDGVFFFVRQTWL